jgi:hypothetical protein
MASWSQYVIYWSDGTQYLTLKGVDVQMHQLYNIIENCWRNKNQGKVLCNLATVAFPGTDKKKCISLRGIGSNIYLR